MKEEKSLKNSSISKSNSDKRKRIVNPEKNKEEVKTVSNTVLKSSRLSKNALLFVDCYWDRKEDIYVRLWRYHEATGGIMSRALYPANESEPLYGFAIPQKEKEEIDAQIKTGEIERARILKQHYYGKWERVIDENLIQCWRKYNNKNKTLHAISFLEEINSGEYIAIKTELERLAIYEAEDQKYLNTDDIIKDYFGTKSLYLKKDEPSYIREVERVSLKRIRDDFQKWFYSHDVDPIRIVFDTVQKNVSNLEKERLVSEDAINAIFHICKKDMEEHPRKKTASYKLIREYLEITENVPKKKIDIETERVRAVMNRRLKSFLERKKKNIRRYKEG
jgi:hypothetical protein